jgi:hypothetical protein
VTVVALGSVRGAPGVTATALALAAPLPGVLVEADLSGGVLATRYTLGREPGLTTLVAGARASADADWRDHAQSAGGVPVVVGPDSASVARALWQRAGDRAAAILGRLDTTVVADLGRLIPPIPLAGSIDVGLLVMAPQAEHLVSASQCMRELRQAARTIGVVVAGDGPYRPADIARCLGADLFGVVPHDPRGAGALEGRAGSARVLARSMLTRAGIELAASVSSALARSQSAAVAR